MLVKNQTLINRYKILSLLKSGAMGCIYKALDTHLDNVVALKQMLYTFTKPQEIAYAEQRFKEEAKLLAKLHHGGLPKVIDHFIAQDPSSQKASHYLVMTFIEGKDLETAITERQKGPFLMPSELLPIFCRKGLMKSGVRLPCLAIHLLTMLMKSSSHRR